MPKESLHQKYSACANILVFNPVKSNLDSIISTHFYLFCGIN